MDPDSGSYFNGSLLFKASVLTLSFTTLQFYRSEKHSDFLQVSVPEQETVNAMPAAEKKQQKKKKTIYLTFDDGPDSGTKNVMAIIKKEEVAATMFLVGQHVYGSRAQQEIYDSLVACGFFEIANHSFTHAFGNRFNQFYDDADSAVSDFVRCADSLNLKHAVIRTPGRNIWRTDAIHSTDIRASAAAGDSLYKHGFTAIGWDLEWHYDARQRLVQTDSEMLHLVDSAFAGNRMKTKNCLVLLAHDRNFADPDDSARLHRFITALKKSDAYEFTTLSRYPGLTIDSAGTK